jgi:hypothetical protein
MSQVMPVLARSAAGVGDAVLVLALTLALLLLSTRRAQ